MMAQAQWPANDQASLNCSKRISVGILFLLCDALLKFERFCCCKSFSNTKCYKLREKWLKCFKISAKKTALLKFCIKVVSAQGETKRYLFGLCETRFVERHGSIPVKHSKLGAKNFNKVCPKSVQNALKYRDVPS